MGELRGQSLVKGVRDSRKRKALLGGDDLTGSHAHFNNALLLTVISTFQAAMMPVSALLSSADYCLGKVSISTE